MIKSWDATKVKRHLKWLRESGPKALIEEDNLNVGQLASNVLAREKFLRANPNLGDPQALWLLGAQRSGTNMAMRGLARHGAVRVYNENHRKAFSGFQLLAPPTIRALVQSSRQPVVAFKPLCDSDRAIELLDEVGAPESRAVWLYRDVDGRARSAVKKFGDSNLEMMRALAVGADKGEWWSRSVSDETRETIRSLDPASMSAHDAAATFWWVRNSLFFDQELQTRDDVLLLNYTNLLTDPVASMEALCSHVGLSFEQRTVDDFEPYRTKHNPLDLASGVRELCDALSEKLSATL